MKSHWINAGGILTPVRDPEDEKKFDDVVVIIHKRFGRAMKKLAE